MIRIDPDDDDVVIAFRTHLDEKDHRMPGTKLRLQCVDRCGSADRAPASFCHSPNERVDLDAARPAIDERREFLDARMRVAPIAKDHCDGGTAA